MKHTYTYFRSSLSFREARLCFEGNGLGGNTEVRSNVPAPEQPANKHLEAVNKAITSIANMEVPLGRQVEVNITELRIALQMVQKNPLAITSLLQLQNRAVAYPGIARMIDDAQNGRPVMMNAPLQEDIRRFIQVQQGQTKVNTGVQKTNVEQQSRFKELRSKLAKLEMEVKRADNIHDTKEKIAHMKRQQEEIQQLLLIVGPTQIQEFAREIGVLDLKTRLEDMLSLDAAEPARKRLLEGLRGLNTGTSYQQYITEEGIMKIARNVASNDLTRNLLGTLREWGLPVEAETVVNFLFTTIRAMAANAFATSKWFNAMPELRERGRQYHYRIALEAHLRAQNAQNQSTGMDFTEMLTRTNADLELLAMPVAANREKMQRDWNSLYEEWRTVGQRLRQNNMSAALPPVPSIAQAADMAGAGQKYLASINQLPPAQNNAPTENAQPRTFDTLVFNPPHYSIDIIVGQLYTVKINNTRMDFQKTRDNYLQVRMGGESAQFKTFFDANANDANRITSLAFKSPTANRAHLEIRPNGRDQGVTLNALQTEAMRDENRSKNKIIFGTSNTLQFAV